MEKLQNLNIEFKNKDLEWKIKFDDIMKVQDLQKNELLKMEKQAKTRILDESFQVKYILII